jgi:hypothetical protein
VACGPEPLHPLAFGAQEMGWGAQQSRREWSLARCLCHVAILRLFCIIWRQHAENLQNVNLLVSNYL